MELALTERPEGYRRVRVRKRVPTLSAQEKAVVTDACQTFIDEVLKPLPDIVPSPFNYPIDIHGKWRGQSYSFIQRYRSGFADNLGEEFDHAFTRLDWVARDRFNIMWHRHTGAWFRLYSAETLSEALKTIETHGHLQPV